VDFLVIIAGMKRIGIFRTLLICGALSVTSLAQKDRRSEQAKPETDQQTLSVNVDLVNVLFTVADKKGTFITNLDKEDFKVFEDDKPQSISNFSNETNLPLSVALVLDTSASITGRLKFEQEAAGEFFYSALRSGTDKALVVAFDRSVALLQDYTDNSELLTRAVGRVHAGGGTALFDAVYLAMTKKLMDQKGRHVGVLISDGDDNSSDKSIDETIAMAQKTDTVIYAVSTNSPKLFGSESDRGNKNLKSLAEETGGKLFTPTKIEDLTKSFLEITNELRSQYTLAYRSTNTKRDGTYRRIRITVANKQFKVRARDGYYAFRTAANSPS
jgi:Ca-activated chloride channel homolog